jgi:hypothetical protein
VTDGVGVGVGVFAPRIRGEAVGVGEGVGVGVDHSISSSSERVTVVERVVVDVLADFEVENEDDVELVADVTVAVGVG